jgi:hypothetical protein
MDENKKYITIDQVLDFVTNIDSADLSSNYVKDCRGFRFDKTGTIGVRDFGTINQIELPDGITQIYGCNMYIPSEDKEYIVVVGYDDSDNMRIFVYDDPPTGTPDELTRMLNAKVNGTPSSTAKSVNIDDITNILGISVTLSSDELINYIVYNSTRNNSICVTSNTVSSITCLNYLGSLGLNWQDNDVLKIYRFVGILPSTVLGPDRGYEFSNGTNPHIRFLSNDVLNKLIMFYGDSSTLPTMRQPIKLTKGKYFGTSKSVGESVSYYLEQLDGECNTLHLDYGGYTGFMPYAEGIAISLGEHTLYSLGSFDGWYINKAQLLPDFRSAGSTTSPRNIGASNEEFLIGEGLKVQCIYGEDTSDGKYHGRYYMTLLYMGLDDTVHYQESDPVFQSFVSPTSDDHSPYMKLKIKINLSLFNRSIIGVNLYCAMQNDEDIESDLSKWMDSGTEYVLMKTLYFNQEIATIVSESEYFLEYTTPKMGLNYYNLALTSLNPSIDSNLQHPIDKNREYLTPRYGLLINSQQGSVVIVDEDDKTLRISQYSGAGSHMDECFPDVNIDNTGNIKKIFLLGRGELLGLSHINTEVIAFRNVEMETFDLISGVPTSIPIDCYSKNSIIGVGEKNSPFGVSFSGRSGIYFIPSTGGSVRMINKKWSNMFDGTLMTDDNYTQYFEDEFKGDIISGWDYIYRELWFYSKVNKKDQTESPNYEYLCFIYSPENDKWRIRELNIEGNVKYFMNRIDGKFLIGTTNGILLYPNRTKTADSNPYEDDLEIDGTRKSPPRGIPTKIRINIGEVYDLDPMIIFDKFLLDFHGYNEINDYIKVNIYVEDRTTPYDSFYYRINNKPNQMKIKPIGQAKVIEIEILLENDSDLYLYQWLELSKIKLITNAYNLLGNN